MSLGSGSGQLGQTAQGQSVNGLPHDIQGLLAYPWVPGARELLAGLGLALVAAAAFYLWRKKKSRLQGPLEPQEDPMLALQRKIAALDPPQPFEGKRRPEYFFQLNLLFRHVVELACRFPATDLTLKELRMPLRSFLPFDPGETEEVLRFCERADLIKFAEAETSLEEAQHYYAKVLEWSQTLAKASTHKEPVQAEP